MKAFAILTLTMIFFIIYKVLKSTGLLQDFDILLLILIFVQLTLKEIK